MYNFKQLKVRQKGFAIAVQAFKLAETFPKEQKIGLTQQITRASVSIPSNIAEGSSRSSVKDYSRFLEISLGSSYELETQLLIAEAVKFGDQTICSQMLAISMRNKRCSWHFCTLSAIEKSLFTGF